MIPCLDVRNGRLTKGIKFAGNEDIGDPVESARRYYEEGADEIVFYDITASAEARGIFLDVVERVAEQIFIPFSVGGGISSVADMSGLSRLLRSNALASLENQALWHERDISHSSVERVIMPDSTILADYVLTRLARLLDGLVVKPERMAQVYADSSGHTDRGTKTLLLRFDGKNWRIAREEWAPAVAAAPAGQAQP